MDEIFAQIFQIGFFAAMIRIATPFLFATIGELFCERAGVLNLGIEGIMTFGAMIAWMWVYQGGDLWTALLAADIVDIGPDPVTIPETFAALPKVPGSEYPYVEGFWYLLLTGDVPTMEQTLEVVEDWKQRSQVPEYVIDVLRAMPRDAHPMSMFSAAIHIEKLFYLIQFIVTVAIGDLIKPATLGNRIFPGIDGNIECIKSPKHTLGTAKFNGDGFNFYLITFGWQGYSI